MGGLPYLVYLTLGRSIKNGIIIGLQRRVAASYLSIVIQCNYILSLLISGIQEPMSPASVLQATEMLDSVHLLSILGTSPSRKLHNCREILPDQPRLATALH